MTMPRAIAGGWCLVLLALGAAPPRTVSPGDAEFFERRVRPVLVAECVACHGPEKQKSGLRLDSLPALLKGSESGPVVTPGHPEESPLIEAVRHSGPIKMPPKKALNPAAVADLTTWVKMGAPWPESASPRSVDSSSDAWKRHWAFQPVANPALPRVKDTAWPRASIDPFVLAALEEKGLSPSRSADRRTLIRRATFDLTGLPPTPTEVDAFLADSSPSAFDRVVDRLLASPHYGERWARYWLDVARYADTKGYVFFEDANFPWAYTYRDYVIRAFNADLPYDRFIVEQLAADRLELGRDKGALRAMGFVTLGGRFMNNGHDVIDDRIDVVTRGLLGLTVTCARCHDHKFDPISAKDYYALYGIFASSAEPPIPPLFEDPPSTKEYKAFEVELRTRERKVEEYVAAKHAELVRSARTRAADYLLAAQAALGQPTTEDFMLIADGGDLNPAMLVRWRVYLERTRKRHDPIFAPWHALAALLEAEFATKAPALCATLRSAAGSSRPINVAVIEALCAQPPKSLADVARIYARLLNESEQAWNESSLRAALNKTAPRSLPIPALEELSLVFRSPDGPPNVPFDRYGDLALLPDRPSQAKLQELRKAVETWRANGTGAPPRAMTLEDIDTPVEPRVFLRGNPNNLGESVPRRFLSALSGEDSTPFHEGSGRLELARAIADRNNPLTARVLVNRIWLHYFGIPLVRTPSDFGMRSDPPSHPALLDHLATTFMESGWSIKSLHRRILLSTTYQQASDDREECRRTDPENLLLWKMNRRRLDFESTRDGFLAVSSRLDRRIDGQSIKELVAPQSVRRTLYGFIDRLNLPGLYRTFDFPDPNATSPRRDETTVAPQALFLMNHPFVLDCARAVLKRPEIAGQRDESRRISALYRVIYQREPSAEETTLAEAYLGGHGHSPALWERYVQAMLLSNEFVFVD